VPPDEEGNVRSRAHFKSHPIHPALIPFPFAFLTGALIFDVIGITANLPSFLATAAYLQIAGIATGLLAAVPGVVDYLYSVPPQSSGKKRATRHAIGNVGAIVLFALAWFTRGENFAPGLATILLEGVGTAAMMYSGYLGGTLVSRNMISVDHRYANAGKWQETHIPSRHDGTIVVGHADDLKPGQMKLLWVNGRRLVLARTNEEYTVFDDHCTHRGGSLADGVLIDRTVQCLWHGSQFDTGTGKVVCGPAKSAIRAYQVQQAKDGRLTVVVR
jgi:nitrite reductase/ring-hydroxylating ferredoxin subunit/uncharacterized membrane protein